MGKEEETGSMADERPQKAPRLGSTGSGFGAAAIQRVSNPIQDERRKPCSHLLALEDQVDSVVAKIKSLNGTPRCEHCWLQAFGGAAFGSCKQQRYEPSAHKMVCLECLRCFCAGVGVVTNPLGHAWSHAHKKAHWVALWFDRPHKAYCFMCERGLCSNQSDGEIAVSDTAADDESGAHASRSDTDQLCRVIRGIPNGGNKCYVNALVQCLLALDKLRTWMLGPTAPTGSLGGALKELFEQTTPGNDAGAMPNPDKLLESLGALNPWYAGATMEDSQELLLDMQKHLNQEEQQKWPLKVRGRYPTVVDSIFMGQTSSTLTCKCCLYNSQPALEPFSELSLTLPSKGQTAESVDSPQRSLVTEESNLKKVQTDAMDKDKASKPLNTDCTEAEQVWQSEDDLLVLLQTEENMISFSELLSLVIDVPKNSACASYLPRQQEILVEPKENTVQVSPEDKGKDLSRNCIYGDDEDSNYLASIEQCLADYFKDVEVEWTCDNCKKVSKEAGADSPAKGSASSSTTNEESDCDGKAEKRVDMPTVQDSQSASTPPNSRKEIDLNIAYQVREDQNEQEDMKGKRGNKAVLITPSNSRKEIDLNIAYQVREDQNEQEDRKEKRGNKAVVITKLPPVLTIHLVRFNNDQVKVAGHVSFGENLDVGPFMDPRYEDKDNSSYRLSGVIEHIGDKLDAGHNVAYVRAITIGSGSSLWFLASNGYIGQVPLEVVLKCEAYILFYERMEEG